MKIVTGFVLIFLTFLTLSVSEKKDALASELALRESKDYALFFAVKDYDEWGDLRNPIKDAKAIAADLSKHYGFKTEVVENPTLQEIVQTLITYREMTYAEDAQLFIFFSGHGEFIEETKEGFFVPQNGQLNDLFQSTYLPHSRLERAITTIPCPHILLAIDACYSGTFNDDIALGKGRLGERPGEQSKSEQEQFIERVLAYKSRLYLTSGGKERTPDGLEHSPFTTQLLTALRTFGGSNQILDFDELKSFMKEASPQPHAGQFEGHEAGGDFLFVLDDGTKPSTREVTTRPPRDASPKPQEKEPNNTRQVPEEKVVISPTSTLAEDPAGQAYKTVNINGKTWLQENLNYDVGYGSWCYNDNPKNCEQFGRLYDWVGAKKACQSLGEGWRLPTDQEWRDLAMHFGGFKDALALEGTGDPKRAFQHFFAEGEEGIALKYGGMRQPNTMYKAGNGYYWTSTAARTTGYAWFYFVHSVERQLMRNNFSQKYGYSCRCVQDF